MTARKRRIRVLVIDDSAFNRKVIGEMLDREPDIEVIGKACDGEQGLEIALREEPDAITLDLEMPRMGGFPFLRILMMRKPIPVVVISSHNEPEKVIRALELGAFDFVPKPTRNISPELWDIWPEVVAKVRLAGGVSGGFEQVSRVPAFAAGQTCSATPEPRIPAIPDKATRVVAIAASTGGPQAITEVFGGLPEDLHAAVVVVQHMPPKFTTSFAERLNNISLIRVLEPAGTQPLINGTAYISPGDSCLEVHRRNDELEVRVLPPTGKESIVPSADRLLTSVAHSVGQNALGVVLTGMGRDGSAGAVAMKKKGAAIIAEDESTAVVPGMPGAAVASGAVKIVAPLDRIVHYILQFARTGAVG